VPQQEKRNTSLSDGPLVMLNDSETSLQIALLFINGFWFTQNIYLLNCVREYFVFLFGSKK